MIRNHAENFSLEHYLGKAGGAFEDRFADFRPFVERVRGMGYVLREITGPSGPVVGVRDDATGEGRDVLMLGSNNYLGLANEPYVIEKTIEAVRKFGIGCGGPPLLNGYTTLHRELEERLAAFKHCEAAMLFSAGFMANLGWATGLLGPSDVLVYDSQSHASLYDAIQLGRFEAVHFNHNDMDHLRRRLMQVRWKHAFTNVIVASRACTRWTATSRRCRRSGGCAISTRRCCRIDDAHGTGVLGERGGGRPSTSAWTGRSTSSWARSARSSRSPAVSSRAKRDVINYMRLLSRPYMFSASLPPGVVVGARRSRLLRDHPERVKQLHENVAYLVKGHGARPASRPTCRPRSSRSPCRRRSSAPGRHRLFEEGIFVNGVEYPAVPRDRHRIRMSVMATLTRRISTSAR